VHFNGFRQKTLSNINDFLAFFSRKLTCKYDYYGLILSHGGAKWFDRVTKYHERVTKWRLLNGGLIDEMAKSMCGKNFHTIDSKGRLIIPAKLRDALGEEFYMAPGLEDGCIDVYPEEEWEKFMESLNNLPNSKARIRDLKRYYRANAVCCNVDNQGRTVVPQELREDAGIVKDVVVIGNGRKAEIWNTEVWRANAKDPAETRRELRQMVEEADIDLYG